MASKHSFLSLE